LDVLIWKVFINDFNVLQKVPVKQGQNLPFSLGLTKSINQLLPTFEMDKTGTLVAGHAVYDPATVDHCTGGGTVLHVEDLEVLHGLVNTHCVTL
jgi:hypothetical protein